MVSLEDAEEIVQEVMLWLWVLHAYDAAGNRTEMTDPEGNTTRYFYDAVNRLTEVLEPLKNMTWSPFR